MNFQPSLIGNIFIDRSFFYYLSDKTKTKSGTDDIRINQLPECYISNICSFLNPEDITNFSLTCRFFCKSNFSILKKEVIKNFNRKMEELESNLDQGSKKNIKERVEFFNDLISSSRNLGELISSTLKIIENINDVLGKKNIFLDLGSFRVPGGNLKILAKIFRVFESVKGVFFQNDLEKVFIVDFLKFISRNSMNLFYLKKAYETAFEITNQGLKTKMFSNLFKSLLKNNCLDEATQVIAILEKKNPPLNDELLFELLFDLVEYYAEKNDLEKSQCYANMISSRSHYKKLADEKARGEEFEI